MDCPYCGTELKYHDYYGQKIRTEHYYIHHQSWIEKTGDIYKCPNYEGFDDLGEAKKYQDSHPDTKDLLLEEVTCDSYAFNGFFYTDSAGELKEGYPC